MKFGPVPLAEAEGAILAHSMQAADPVLPESLVYKIPKGAVLTAQHLTDLEAYGVREIVVARLEPGDVHEDAAALRLAQSFLDVRSGLRARAASTGRVNLVADSAGVVEVDADAILAVNSVDPGITIATVPCWQKTGADRLVATIKIIPYAVPGDLLDRACAFAAGALRVHGAQVASVSLIETRTGRTPPPDKGRRAMTARAAHFGAIMSERVVVPHDSDAVAQALRDAPGELLMILTGSATSDFRDTAPEAVRLAGGEIAHYGMPVDPGNLLFIGRLGGKPVIGLPGCARSPALNGADWVLERLMCGIPVTPADIAGMGVGGLLKEIPTRPQPRERRRRPASPPDSGSPE